MSESHLRVRPGTKPLIAIDLIKSTTKMSKRC